MALSNIFREPRREITESVVGITVFSLIVVGPIALAWYAANDSIRQDHDMPWGGVFIIMILLQLAAAAGTHALGEAVCNRLQRAGIHLRPRQRK